ALHFRARQVIDALESAGFPCQEAGREVNADITKSGHYHIKISPYKGVWFDANDGSKTGTISQLFRQLGTRAPDASKASGTTSPRKEETQEKSKNQIEAVNLWNSGSWIAGTPDALPDAWDKGLNAAKKGIARQKFEDQRKIVRNYIKTRLSADHIDHWMYQVRITKDTGLMIMPMRQNGEITGIQRTFFDSFGKKTERKMLGKQGICVLPPPAGVLPRNLGTGCAKNRLIGEGFETVAATVQSAGWAGLACFFDGGIVKYAREQAEAVKDLTPEQIETAAASIFLVDRDQSQAGQIACAKAVKILRMAGLKAFFAMPPAHDQGGPKGGEKGSDWGDYPKEGISSDILYAHLALAIAHGDQDMPEIQETDINPDSGEKITDYTDYEAEYAKYKYGKWRDALIPETPVEARPVSEVRQFLQTELQKTVSDYLSWLKDDTKPFLPVLMMPTTGTGKTTAIKALIKDAELKEAGGRVCVFTANHKEADAYQSAGFFHFYGRTDDNKSPAFCPAYATAKIAQEANHISQAEVCRRCKHGYRWAIDYYSELDAEKNKERIEEAKQKIAEMGDHWTNVIPCKWQSHLRKALDAKYVVAASGSYSHSLTKGALAIFDEHFETGKGIKVKLEDIDEWAKRNESILTFLQKNNGEPEKIGRHKKAAVFFQKIALAMAAWVGKTGSISIDKELTNAIMQILKFAKAAKKFGNDIDLADWETLQFNRAGDLTSAPLRGAHAIAESLKFGDGFVEDGALVIASSLPIMERMASGLPTVIMDATPDPVVIDVVEASDGRIVNAIARQNIRIKRYASRFWGLSELNPKNYGIARVEKAVTKYEKLIQHHFSEFGETAYLMHARAFKSLGFEDFEYNADGDPVCYAGENVRNIQLGMAGYWGRHHRAHDEWAGKELVIVGGFYPPDREVRAMYQTSRIAALSAGASPENWPVWRDEIVFMLDEHVCEGKADVVCRYPLPSDPYIRKWLLARITAETVQAIGRVRGANCEKEITVHIYGGVPLAGLGAHGLTVDSYELDPECVGAVKSEQDEAMHEQREGSLARCDAICSRVIANGGTITRDAMQAEVDAINAANAELGIVDQGGCGDESYLWGVGMYIYTTPPQIQMPDTAVIQDWIKRRMPILADHLSTKGRNGKLVKEAREFAKLYGETALADAMDYAENLVNTSETKENAKEIAWDTIENNPDATTIQLAGARIVLNAMDATEDVPAPWKNESDEAKGSAKDEDADEDEDQGEQL
ncbi:hypothetical protein, partial [Acidithiobacillus thiooxidans]